MPVRPVLLTLTILASVVLSYAADPANARRLPKGTPTAARKGQKAKVQKPATTAPAGTSGAMVFVDPATGQIVEPTDAQIGSLAPKPEPNVAPKAPAQMIQGPGGAVGMVVTPDMYSYSVATVTPDGKLAVDCVTGEDAAKKAMNGKEPGDAKKK